MDEWHGAIGKSLISGSNPLLVRVGADCPGSVINVVDRSDSAPSWQSPLRGDGD